MISICLSVDGMGEACTRISQLRQQPEAKLQRELYGEDLQLSLASIVG